MENNICNSMILTSRRRHFYLVGQSKHKVGACGVNNQASPVLAGNELPFVAFRESTKLPLFVFEAVREIYRSIFGVASFKKVDRFRSEIQLAGHPVRGLNHKILEANSQVQNVKLGGHQTCLSINRLWHELCDMLRRLVGTTAPGHHDCSIQE
ncbi:uncharacterized protein TNCV_5135381 [Trichonephila clavipes]|nr:uncharacterized protein TNCV_5135381 [Trichonephila clavipes]